MDNNDLAMVRPELTEEFLRSLVNGSDDAIITKTLEGIVTSWNPAAEKMFGYTAEEMIGATVLRLFPDDLIAEEKTIIGKIRRGERIRHYETIRKKKDGSSFPASVTISPIRDGDGEVIGASKIVRDMSIERALESEMRLSATVFDHASEAIIITDAEGRFIHVNRAFTSITGYTLNEVLGQTPAIFKSSRQGPELQLKMLAELKAKGHCQGEIWSRKKTGEAFAALVSVSRVTESGGSPGRYIAMFADTTAIREQQELMERMAHFDLLTDLPNRILLAERLERCIRKADKYQSEFAVAYLDLDGFKLINDNLGHSAGDDVLAVFGRRMSAVLRDGDTLARVGGDEFVLLIEFERDSDDYLTALGRILSVCKAPILLDDVEVTLSASVGVTLYPNDPSTADLLLRHADQAMYEAKQAGRDQIKFFDTTRDQKARKTYSLVNELGRAIEKNELFLEYQPKVDVTTGQIIGAEALLRWRSADGRILYPSDFLLPIEDWPVIDDIGQWVIQNALAQIEAWHRLGKSVPVSVNIAPRHFLQPEFPAQLKKLMEEHGEQIGIERLLEIEIVETQKFFDLSQVARIMQDCSQLGVRFSLDDFGTGYSSLAYLKALPAETLKIDRSFIMSMTSSPNDMLIVKALIGLAKAFNREVVAEGVETEEQVDILVGLGCFNIQGYGIARPMSAERFLNWSESWATEWSMRHTRP